MITLKIVAITVLILLNGVLAMSEMAIVSSRRPRLRQMASDGSVGAKRVLELLDDPSDFLAAVQIGITLVGVLAGAFGGAAFAEGVSVYIAKIAVLAPYSEGLALGLVVTTITYFSLVIGELAPKNLGMARAERIAVIVVRPILLLALIARPAVRVLTVSTHVALRLVGFKGAARRAVTEEEVKLLIEEGTRAGALEPSEEAMMKRIIRLGDRDVSDVMTPRTQIKAIDIRDSDEESLEKIKNSYHSYLPVYDESKDEIVGMASVKKLFGELNLSDEFNLMGGLQEPLFVPESMPALTALEEFKRSGKHIALVVDEYGGTAGLVTIIDLLEAIVGEVPNEKEVGHPEIVQRRDGSWLIGGMASIDDFKDALGIKTLEAEEEGDFQSVAGLVLHYLGRIPTEGDELEAIGLHFEVVDMDGRRVDKLLVSKLKKPRT
ncbi:hemolysin family protein [Bradymonas sediminis]|uniref:Uncharacterized protein n=1 Tax=Bradymonas sediminis TaxID=1548548 RepID=A0A2Z4FGW0_9DELT|nr:hemolysin family protein [Bradymonas sediminis]AWV87846.1 hypothetical protein DN745_00255 [Bradymonas sediminis]TDP73943.1 putative hemolysin [Bradymonas sediminis]